MKQLDIRPVRRPAPTRMPEPTNHSNNVAPPETPQPAEPAKVTEHTSGLRKWSALVVLALALAIIIIDTTILNVSLRPIISDLHTDIKGLQWVITIYALVLASFTITGGRLGDLFGRRKMFMLGAIIFAVGSFTASISHTLGILVVGEAIIEGLGAALMMPATASLLIANYHGRDRALAFGIWGGIAGASSAIGPILGGYLTTAYSWRWAFRINVFVAAALVIGSLLLIKESRDDAERPQLDFLGILLSASGLFMLVFGIIQSSTFGWFIAKQSYAVFGRLLSNHFSVTVYASALGILLLILFFIWEGLRERMGKTPLVSLELFGIKQFTSGALTMTMMSLSMIGLIFVLPVFFQAVRGLDALHTGLSLLPLSLAVLVMAPLSAVMSHKIAPKYLVQAGIFVQLIAIILLHYEITITATTWSMTPALALYGMGIGLIMAQVSNLTLSAVSVQQSGEAAGVNNTMRQVGSSLGSAILGAVLLTGITANVTKGIVTSDVIPAGARAQLSTAVGAHASDAAFGGANGENTQVPAAVKAEIETIAKQATSDAASKTVLYSIPFTLLAFMISTQLPKARNVETEKSVAHTGH